MNKRFESPSSQTQRYVDKLRLQFTDLRLYLCQIRSFLPKRTSVPLHALFISLSGMNFFLSAIGNG